MDPGPTTSVLQPTRQSCNRCHKQKLRCDRPQDGDGNGTSDTCERCLRKGVRCTYSSSLPKGRPSIYRLGMGAPDLTKDIHSRTSMSAMFAPGRSKASEPQRPTNSAAASGVIDHCVLATAPSDVDTPDFWTQFMQTDENDIAVTGIMPDVDITFDPLPTPPHITPVGPAHAVQQYRAIKFVEDQQPKQPLEQQHQQQQQPAPQRHHSRTASASGPFPTQQVTNVDTIDTWSEQSQLNESIVHLSQLSARLSSLLTCSRDVPIVGGSSAGGSIAADENSEVLQLQSSIGAVFESINTWLAQSPARPPTAPAQQYAGTSPSSQSQLVSHTLAASSEMTRILHHLRLITSIHTPMTTTPDSSRGSPRSESSKHPYYTIQYLVVVCVTLLLNTYVAVLISLQHSADTLKTHQCTSSSQQQSRQEATFCTWDTIDRIKLQFGGVVQMCSSFMRRQSEVFEMLVPGDLSPETQGTRTSWDAVEKLKVELERRLRRLQS